MVLKVGERKVYTTPSSLANRMGVVKGQTGDGFQYAANLVSKTIDAFAQRQTIIEEENWKNDYKLKTFESLSKFARDNPDSPSDYMAQSSSYIESSVGEAPEKFRSWAKSYSGMMSAQNFNGISLQAIKKKQIQAVTLFNESSSSEITDMNDLILNTNSSDNLADYEKRLIESKSDFKGLYPNFTTLFGENILPRISELVTSYTKLYNSLDPSFIAQMDSPEEYMRSLKVGFEQSRVIADDKQLLDQAIALQEEGYIGSKVVGWTSIGAVDKALDIIGERAENYLFEPDAGDGDGPFVFRETTQEERLTIKAARLDWSTKYGNEFKAAERTLSKIELANIKIGIERDTNYNAFALNSSTKDWTLEEFNSYVKTNFWGATDTQLVTLENAYNEGVITRNSIKFNDNFETTVGSIQLQLNNYSGQKKAQIELNVINSKMSDYMLQLNKDRDDVDLHNNGMINPNDFNVDVIVLKDEKTGKLTMVDILPDSFQAAINLASSENVVHPQLKNMLQSSINVNTENLSDLNELYKISQIHSNLVNRFGTSLDLVGEGSIVSDSLIDFWNDVKNKPDDISLKFYGEKFLSKVNPGNTNYDEKKLLLEKIMIDKGIDFGKIIEQDLVPSSGWMEDAWKYLTGNSDLSVMPERGAWTKFGISMLPFGGDGTSQTLEEERRFIFTNGDIKNKFNEYAYEYLIAMNPDINKITPLHFEATGFFDIANWNEQGNEAGLMGVRAIKYAFQRLGKEGYGMN